MIKFAIYEREVANFRASKELLVLGQVHSTAQHI